MGMLLRLHKLNNKGVKPEKAAPINKTPEKVKDTVVDTTTTSPEVEPEVEEKPTYSRSQIQLMPVAGLKEVAKAYGVDDYENKSGAKLKKELLEIMGL
jgi:hypothetical protein